MRPVQRPDTPTYIDEHNVHERMQDACESQLIDRGLPPDSKLYLQTQSVDSGTQNFDSGTQSFDSGTQSFDSGTQSFDSGTQNFDSGTLRFDSGTQSLTPPRRALTPVLEPFTRRDFSR